MTLHRFLLSLFFYPPSARYVTLLFTPYYFQLIQEVLHVCNGQLIRTYARVRELLHREKEGGRERGGVFSDSALFVV